MKKHKRPEDFIQPPGYPGGKEALSKFIKQEMRYPKEALEKKIEGTVVVAFSFNENGKVIHTKVEHGIGYGCDEEAQRIVKKLRYPKVKHKGVRVTFNSKINVHFRLKDVVQKQGVKYSYSSGSTSSSKETGEQAKPKSYTYTIKINKN